MRIVALLYALSWVAVRGMLVCGCPASKGGILRARSPAGRRFRASALVSGRKITMYIPYMCTFSLVVAFRDARFLSGLYHRFSYIVTRRLGTRPTAPSRDADGQATPTRDSEHEGGRPARTSLIYLSFRIRIACNPLSPFLQNPLCLTTLRAHPCTMDALRSLLHTQSPDTI